MSSNFLKCYNGIVPNLVILFINLQEVLTAYAPEIQVYNPLLYGHDGFVKLISKYLKDKWPSQIVIGLNPGVDGAVQTCIPFTDPYHAYHKLGINPSEYIKTHINVNPLKYINNSHEPSTKLFYLAIESMGSVDEFYSRTLVINAFPLGLSYLSLRPNRGNFYIKNITPTDLPKGTSAIVREMINYCADEYLKLIVGLFQGSQLNIVAMSSYARDRLNKLGIKNDYLIHPSPSALRTKGIKDEDWKKRFAELLI